MDRRQDVDLGTFTPRTPPSPRSTARAVSLPTQVANMPAADVWRLISLAVPSKKRLGADVREEVNAFGEWFNDVKKFEREHKVSWIF